MAGSVPFYAPATKSAMSTPVGKLRCKVLNSGLANKKAKGDEEAQALLAEIVQTKGNTKILPDACMERQQEG